MFSTLRQLLTYQKRILETYTFKICIEIFCFYEYEMKYEILAKSETKNIDICKFLIISGSLII